jgi:hypothetical protein
MSAQKTLAQLIHDDVLQMLGVCLLEAELCRRFSQKGQPEQVVAELNEVLQALGSVVATSQRVLGDPQVAAAMPSILSSSAERARPQLAVVSAVDERSATHPEEILQTLNVCMLQVELCRVMYQGGREHAALVELTMLVQRLESVVEMYREVMDCLRGSERPKRLVRFA